jgi:hypothetical protein
MVSKDYFGSCFLCKKNVGCFDLWVDGVVRHVCRDCWRVAWDNRERRRRVLSSNNFCEV